ncbi:proteinase-activated receptor 1-like [Lacerta agilis]|uniref:proteinase-activated receptor 1-like n=1 Tax=Lacerta agilis TaxID=80427 RepID=UPI00141A4886|nr:proteinase-activated receptor 1-like [Lacerta agilis]
MGRTLKIFSLLNILCTLHSTVRANNSSVDAARSLLPILDSPSTHENELDIHNQNTESIRFSEDIEKFLTSPWVTRFVPSVHVIVVMFSLPLNIMAILVFVVKIRLKKPATVYMLNLAFADVLFVCVLPFKIIYHFSGNNWTFGPEMCRFATSAFHCNMYCSILLMVVISIDRFLAVVYPMQSLSWRTPRQATLTCFAIWIIAIAGVIPLLLKEQTERFPRLNITTCLDSLALSTMNTLYRYFSVVSILFFYIPLLISGTCYVCIIKRLSSADVATKPGKKKRAIILSVAVLSSFIICFGPTNVVFMLQVFSLLPEQQVANLLFACMLATCITTISCCIDPLIYYYASSECKRQVWRLLCYRKHSDLERSIQFTSSNIETS